MVRLAVDTRRVAGHTLVEGRLHNDASEAVRVTLATPLSPVYPPRSRGRPVAGWRPAEGRTTVCLAVDQHVGVGFATPATPDERALTVVETERAPATDGGLTATPAAVVDALADPLPPPEVTRSAPPADSGEMGATPTAAADGLSAPRLDDSPPADAGTAPDTPGRDSGPSLRRLRRAATDLARATAAVERRLEGTR